MDKLIPKVIHYAWFGRGKKPNSVLKCIESWKKYLPEYDIIEWNEDNFDLNSYIYTREAYDAKKFAYVTDVVRLYALYNYGGIYMDTDVEVLRPLDEFLVHHGFSGFQSESEIQTGVMGSVKENQWVLDQLRYYKDARFIKENGKYDYTTNVDIISRISLNKHGFIPNGKYQVLKYGFVIYPKEYFCPKFASSGKIKVTNNTYTIHHFKGSWVPGKQKFHKLIYRTMINILGQKTADEVLMRIKQKNKKL